MQTRFSNKALSRKENKKEKLMEEMIKDIQHLFYWIHDGDIATNLETLLRINTNSWRISKLGGDEELFSRLMKLGLTKGKNKNSAKPKQWDINDII